MIALTTTPTIRTRIRELMRTLTDGFRMLTTTPKAHLRAKRAEVVLKSLANVPLDHKGITALQDAYILMPRELWPHPGKRRRYYTARLQVRVLPGGWFGILALKDGRRGLVKLDQFPRDGKLRGRLVQPSQITIESAEHLLATLEPLTLEPQAMATAV